MWFLNRGCVNIRSRPVAIVALAITITGCAESPSDRSTGESSTTIQIPERGERAWAEIVATGAFAARSPGYPVRIREYRREGSDHVIVYEPVGLGLGGGGIVRVSPDGSTQVSVYQ